MSGSNADQIRQLADAANAWVTEYGTPPVDHSIMGYLPTVYAQGGESENIGRNTALAILRIADLTGNRDAILSALRWFIGLVPPHRTWGGVEGGPFSPQNYYEHQNAYTVLGAYGAAVKYQVAASDVEDLRRHGRAWIGLLALCAVACKGKKILDVRGSIPPHCRVGEGPQTTAAPFTSLHSGKRGAVIPAQRDLPEPPQDFEALDDYGRGWAILRALGHSPTGQGSADAVYDALVRQFPACVGFGLTAAEQIQLNSFLNDPVDPQKALPIVRWMLSDRSSETYTVTRYADGGTDCFVQAMTKNSSAGLYATRVDSSGVTFVLMCESGHRETVGDPTETCSGHAWADAGHVYAVRDDGRYPPTAMPRSASPIAWAFTCSPGSASFVANGTDLLGLVAPTPPPPLPAGEPKPKWYQGK